MDIIYDLDKDYFRIFTFDWNIYQIVLFKCDNIIFYVLLGSLNILVLYSLRKYWK